MEITCPHCDKTIKAPDKYAGKQVKCPGCGGQMELPTLEELGISAPPADPAPPPAPAAAPPPPPPEPEYEEEPEKEEAPAPSTSRRPSSRRSSGTAKKESSRPRQAEGDADAALAGYRRNMSIMGALLVLFGLLTGAVAVLFIVVIGAGAAVAAGAAGVESAPPQTGTMAAGLAAIAGIIGAVFGAVALVELILGVCAFLKKHWVNWVVAIFYGIGLLLTIAAIIKTGQFQGSIGTGVSVLMLVLAVLNIRSYGKIRAAGLDPSGGSSGGGRSRKTSDRAGKPGRKPGRTAGGAAGSRRRAGGRPRRRR